MKKSKFKSWLIKILRKALKRLGADENVVKIERVDVPLTTVSAKIVLSERDLHIMPEEDVQRALAIELSKEIIKYAEIQSYRQFDVDLIDNRIVYKATLRVVGEE